MNASDLSLVVAAVAFVLVLMASHAVRRVLLAVAVAVRYLLLGISLRVRGEKGAAPFLIRRAFEDLGPTWIKMGQLVASSHGLFPDRYVVEFGKCLDRVRGVPFDEIEAILREDLSLPIGEVFSFLDPKPIASASIAQVHAARLVDGRDVVVKVQRPNIRPRVDADVLILRACAAVLGRLPRIELANPVGIIEDFDATIHEELDFAREATNMIEFNAIMRDLGHVDAAAPKVVREHTSSRVLVMERFYGVRIDDAKAIHARTDDAEGMLVLGLRVWFQCMILRGFFHGDVHAGNLMLLDDGRLGFLDFGIIGRFDDHQRRQVTDYIVAFATGDYRRLGEVMLEMGSVKGGIDLDTLAADLKVAYAPMLRLSFGELKYGELLPSILRVAAKNEMRLPREFVLVTKQMLFFDRYAKLLAPKLNLFSDPRLVAGLTEDVAKARST